ncbi:hypothetical protein PF008_g14806 [Phytophthora fragariae]|uniref:Uncharacterized protein n=1 Tax=Phytophthora fragariae TaxID=53985 RepID=A0A6G0RHC2_9STRA|nr:hypothetical protein PF008_g14806 [Phytophthora fragariae]
MVTSDAAFLAEVENFLSGTDLAAVSDNNGGAPVPAPVDGSTKPKPRTRRRTKTPTDAEEKSRLQKAKARTRQKQSLPRAAEAVPGGPQAPSGGAHDAARTRESQSATSDVSVEGARRAAARAASRR